jgi:aspartyl-tRNA(Asn)/glutamyl-tRNA(Gln) amidotransferase subunit C
MVYYAFAMARVTAATVEHVAKLASLSLTAEERETFARQLEEILTYAEAIQALDTEKVEPMSHARTSEIFRPDAPHTSLPTDRATEPAPDAADGLFRVPRVL